MSISETQYYEAKVFLRALLDAHTTLEYLFLHSEMQPKSKPKWKSLNAMKKTLSPLHKMGILKSQDSTFIKQIPSMDQEYLMFQSSLKITLLKDLMDSTQ